jgi:hypothetical protein
MLQSLFGRNGLRENLDEEVEQTKRASGGWGKPHIP